MYMLDRRVKELEYRLAELDGEWWVLQAHIANPAVEQLLEEVNGEWWALQQLLHAAMQGIPIEGVL